MGVVQRQAPSSEDDRSLLARLAGGDGIALETLYRRHAPWLTTRLDSRCGDRELADAALQETFLAVWRKPTAYRGDGDVAAWLWGIAVRRLIDELRRRRVPPIDPALITDPLLERQDVFHRTAPAGTEEMALADPRYGELGSAIQNLAPELRAVLIATAIDGLSTKEAARLLGVPQGTVKTRLMRARHAMQEALA